MSGLWLLLGMLVLLLLKGFFSGSEMALVNADKLKLHHRANQGHRGSSLVLDLFRQYFEQYEIEPPMRALVRLVRDRLGEEKGSSRYLYRLFPDGPGTQACRMAGLPRPVSCI